MNKMRSKEANIYLKMEPRKKAQELMFRSFEGSVGISVEHVPVTDAVGRVTAQAIPARLSSPNFHAAAMDGIAVQAAKTFGASETTPISLTIGTDAFAVNTGHVLLPNTDAVIMIENVHQADETTWEINAPATPWQHVRKVGEDIVATELLFPSGHLITPYCIGALISGGVFQVPVCKKPRVLIIPTGSEVVDWREQPDIEPKPGQVLESNATVLGELVCAWGGTFLAHPIVEDNPDKIRQAVSQGVEQDIDIVLTIGGSSAGSKDLAKQVFQALGEVLVHGITMMPGKPLIISRIAEKPVFGIPGYQVSAILAFEQFVGPLIRRMVGLGEMKRPVTTALPARKIPSKLGMEEFLRVRLGVVNGRMVAAPLPRGAGNITTITEADGVVRIPADSEGVNEDQPVEVELLRPLTAIEDTVVVVGSHDNSLDLLADLLARQGQARLSSSNVGSMGGLLALKKGVSHLAGSHLLDTKTGIYNRAYIDRFLPDMAVKQVNLIFRDQGLIVPKGNPKNIQGLEDLRTGELRFLNRQRGSGTRILLDYRLDQLGLDSQAINGYANEEFTHMAVAVAVLTGAADTGLGIFAAAKALNLDFIPVVTEQYDLIIPEAYYHWDKMQALLKTIQSDLFKTRVASLGGYHTEKTGQIMG